jgi:drug/metabolite transporter (DMT)-like permease
VAFVESRWDLNGIGNVQMRVSRGVLNALAAAVLFGASTPFAKALVGEITPVLLAGLLYAGSGLGLGAALIVRRLVVGRASSRKIAWPRPSDAGWLAGATFFGGLVGPVLLMLGLASTAASVSALLLNLEAVFTAGIAWFVFRENFDRRIAAGMTLIVFGGLVLSWTPGNLAISRGSLLIAGACLCWAIDNNLTRKVSATDAMTVACAKGLIAGAVNTGAALLTGAMMPSLSITAEAAVVGLAGYGISLTLFVLALRDLGTARTSAYFSVAPFFGAALALLLNGESATWQLGIASAAMAAGVWLHVTERHAHLHMHGHQEHAHAHYHDEHHQHAHDFAWDGREPHTHAHVHAPLVHSHPHYPDVHHRHPH